MKVEDVKKMRDLQQEEFPRELEAFKIHDPLTLWAERMNWESTTGYKSIIAGGTGRNSFELGRRSGER